MKMSSGASDGRDGHLKQDTACTAEGYFKVQVRFTAISGPGQRAARPATKHAGPASSHSETDPNRRTNLMGSRPGTGCDCCVAAAEER